MKINYQGLKIIFCGRIGMFFLRYPDFLLLGADSFLPCCFGAKMEGCVGSSIFFYESSLMAAVLLQSRKRLIYFAGVLFFCNFA